MDRKILGTFAIVLIATSILKLTGLNIVLIEGYEKIATSIMVWLVPEIFTETYPAGYKTLALYMPIIFTLNVALFVWKLIKYRKRATIIVYGDEE